MGSFALRDPRVFAYEWASLDVLSGGRTRLSVCAGGGTGAALGDECEAMGFPPGQRRRRMIENIAVLRHLWTRDNEPIWLTTNAGRLANGQADAGGVGFRLASHRKN